MPSSLRLHTVWQQRLRPCGTPPSTLCCAWRLWSLAFPPSESVSRGPTPLALCLSPLSPSACSGRSSSITSGFCCLLWCCVCCFLCCSPSCVLSARGPAEIVLGHLLCYISPSYLRVRRWGVGTLGLTEDFSFWHSLSSSVVFTWL